MITIINNGNLAVDIPRGGSSFPLFSMKLRMFVLMEGGKPEDPEKKLSEQRQEQTTNSTHMSNITLPLFFLVKTWDSWFIEEQNSFLAHVNPFGPTHVSFYYGFRWGRESEQYHIKIIIVFLLWLTSVWKLTFCFADRKQRFSSQLFACHPLNAFVYSCLLVK